MKRIISTTLFLAVILLATGCQTNIIHHPSKSLDALKAPAPKTILVADIGDARIGEAPHAIGFGVSYWLPVGYWAKDEKGPLPVSYYVAQSLSTDLNKVGYSSTIADHGSRREPLTPEKAKNAASKAGVDYLIQTRTTDGKTNFWGFLVIPFFNPVWTKIGFDVEMIDMKTDEEEKFSVYKKETEWYFAKIFIFEALFDAGIFGKHWHRDAWGKTVVPDVLAEATAKIVERAD